MRDPWQPFFEGDYMAPHYKVILGGGFSSGKTTFLRSIDEGICSGEGYPDTMPYNHACLSMADDKNLILFEPPGSRRFDFMWELLSTGMLGSITMLDSRYPETFKEAKSHFETFRAYAPVSHVIAANFQDHPNAWSPDDLRIIMKIPDDVPIIPCVATDPKSVAQVLIALCELVLAEIEADA